MTILYSSDANETGVVVARLFVENLDPDSQDQNEDGKKRIDMIFGGKKLNDLTKWNFLGYVLL